MNELGETQDTILIGNDNSGAISIAENKGCIVGRVRHIHACVHWFQDIVADGLVALRKVPTAEMPAAVLTKALAYQAHARHAGMMKGKLFPVKP